MQTAKNAISDILSRNLGVMLESLKSDTAANYRRKSHNFLLSQLDQKVLFYTVFTSSFESKSGNAMENCAKDIAKFSYGVAAVPSIIVGVGATEQDRRDFEPSDEVTQYILTRVDIKKAQVHVTEVMQKCRSSSDHSFTVNQIEDVAALAQKLREKKNGVTAFIYSHLSANAKARLEKHTGDPSSQIREDIIQALNQGLDAPLYSSVRFDGVDLSEEVRKKAETSKSKDVRRVLLESAFPSELAVRRAGVNQEILRAEILRHAYETCDNLQYKPVDLFIQRPSEDALCMELKLGGDLDSSNAPAQIAKMLTTCAIAKDDRLKGYFATIYNKDGEGKPLTGVVRSYLFADMILAGSKFWEAILPDSISFSDFVQIYHTALEKIGLNSAIGELVERLVPSVDKQEAVDELTEK